MRGGGLDNHRIAPPVGDHVELFLRRVGLLSKKIDVARAGALVLVQVLQLFGHILRVRVFEDERFHGFFLGVVGVERGNQPENRVETGLAGQHHQRVRALVRGHIDRFAAGFLIKRPHLFGQRRRGHALERNHAHRHVFGLVSVERFDEFTGKADVVGVVRQDDLVVALVKVNRALVRKRAPDPLLQFGRLNMLERKNLHDSYPALG